MPLFNGKYCLHKQYEMNSIKANKYTYTEMSGFKYLLYNKNVKCSIQTKSFSHYTEYDFILNSICKI